MLFGRASSKKEMFVCCLAVSYLASSIHFSILSVLSPTEKLIFTGTAELVWNGNMLSSAKSTGT